MDDIERLWTHQETARYLHVSPWTLTELIRQKCGPTMFRVGRNRRYDPANVNSWLHRNAIEANGQRGQAGRHVRAEPSDEDRAPLTGSLGAGAAVEQGSVAR